MGIFNGNSTYFNIFLLSLFVCVLIYTIPFTILFYEMRDCEPIKSRKLDVDLFAGFFMQTYIVITIIEWSFLSENLVCYWFFLVRFPVQLVIYLIYNIKFFAQNKISLLYFYFILISFSKKLCKN